MSLVHTLILGFFILWSSPKFNTSIEAGACAVIIIGLAGLSIILNGGKP